MTMTLLLCALAVALLVASMGGLTQLFVYRFTAAGSAFAAQAMTAAPDASIQLAQADGNPIFTSDRILQTAYVFGQTDISDVLLVTPNLRIVQTPHIRPFDAATTPQSRPFLPGYWREQLRLLANESISVQLSGLTGTNLANYYAGLWVADTPPSAPSGHCLTVHFTASIATVTNGWANGGITFDQALPTGMYDVVGLDVYGTNLAFARLIMPNQMPRGGCIAGQTPAYIGAPCFRFGQMGSLGRFSNVSVPQLDVYAIGAGSSQTGFMDLIKVG
jgi:hypothetical protein